MVIVREINGEVIQIPLTTQELVESYAEYRDIEIKEHLKYLYEGLSETDTKRAIQKALWYLSQDVYNEDYWECLKCAIADTIDKDRK